MVRNRITGKFKGSHTMEVTTIVGCRNMCSYCPQDKVINAYSGNRLMSFEDFKKILSNIPKDVEIYFAGLSESFMNPESSLMMKHAVEEGYVVVVYTTLVGLTQNDIYILSTINGAFAGFAFHRFDGKGYNKEEFNTKQNVIRTQVLGIDPISMDDDQEGRVTRPVSRAGNKWDETVRCGRLRCSSTPNFDNNSLMPNGDVYLCCMDYSLQHKIGNLLQTHYNQLDRSNVFNLADQINSDIICRKCVVARYF